VPAPASFLGGRLTLEKEVIATRRR